MLPTFCPPTIWGISLEFYRKLSILAADDFLGACYIRGRQLGDGMGGGRNGHFWGAPIFGQTLKNTAFFHKKVQNRGAPKTAVPTTTHPIPQLAPSYYRKAMTPKKLWTLLFLSSGAFFFAPFPRF